MEAHRAKMDDVVNRALEKAGMASPTEVDAVAVTVSTIPDACTPFLAGNVEMETSIQKWEKFYSKGEIFI